MPLPGGGPVQPGGGPPKILWPCFCRISYPVASCSASSRLERDCIWCTTLDSKAPGQILFIKHQRLGNPRQQHHWLKPLDLKTSDGIITVSKRSRKNSEGRLEKHEAVNENVFSTIDDPILGSQHLHLFGQLCEHLLSKS